MPMDKQDNYSGNFTGLDYSLDQHHQSGRVEQQTSGDNNCGMVNYMISNDSNSPQNQQQYLPGPAGFGGSTSMDKLSFAEVMQFAEFGPKLALNQTKLHEEESGIDPVYFLKFPVLNDKIDHDEDDESLMVNGQLGHGPNDERLTGVVSGEDDQMFHRDYEEQEARVSDGNNPVQLQFLGDQDPQAHKSSSAPEGKNKRKRARTIKTSEEVESQRMTHIAVERNRRKQMNEHLRVLRSLMPGSYVQRGDQASIIGGAIEFVRELEQLLQCLESQKRRRLYGDQASAGPRQMGGDPSLGVQQPQPPFFPPMPLPNEGQMKLVDLETGGGFREETAENKSCLADVEVKLLGFDAMIKILSRRRPGQLIRTIAALEDLQLTILHTNITTIEQTVLYSFNVKITGESRCTAEDIASSVQQIFSFIHANNSI